MCTKSRAKLAKKKSNARHIKPNVTNERHIASSIARLVLPCSPFVLPRPPAQVTHDHGQPDLASGAASAAPAAPDPPRPPGSSPRRTGHIRVATMDHVTRKDHDQPYWSNDLSPERGSTGRTGQTSRRTAARRGRWTNVRCLSTAGVIIPTQNVHGLRPPFPAGRARRIRARVRDPAAGRREGAVEK
jgi:hypothetical protein